jgi:hypothetical protein
MAETGASPAARYKRILHARLEQRPLGTRQRLATAPGKHKSFVTPITNPAYPVPIPAKDAATVLRSCRVAQGRERAGSAPPS